MNIFEGLSILSIILLATALTSITFVQIEEWAPVWEAWLASDEGPGYSGERLKFLRLLPFCITFAQIAVIIALISPVAVQVRR